VRTLGAEIKQTVAKTLFILYFISAPTCADSIKYRYIIQTVRRILTARVAALDVEIGARKHVLNERVQRRVVNSQFRSRVDRVVKSVRRRRVRVGVEKALNAFTLHSSQIKTGFFIVGGVAQW